MLNLNNISHYGDILAIPFFLLLIIYFFIKKDKTILEYILLTFAFIGLIADIFFTYQFFN